MPMLRPRREAFVRHVLKMPKTGMSQAACYIASGYRARGHSAEVLGSLMLKNLEVKQRMSELAAPSVRKARISMENLLAELAQVIAEARRDKSHSAAVAGLALAAKIAGMMTAELGMVGGGAEDFDGVVDRTIEELGGLDDAIEATESMLNALRDRRAGQAILIR